VCWTVYPVGPVSRPGHVARLLPINCGEEATSICCLTQKPRSAQTLSVHRAAPGAPETPRPPPTSPHFATFLLKRLEAVARRQSCGLCHSKRSVTRRRETGVTLWVHSPGPAGLSGLTAWRQSCLWLRSGRGPSWPGQAPGFRCSPCPEQGGRLFTGQEAAAVSVGLQFNVRGSWTH